MKRWMLPVLFAVVVALCASPLSAQGKATKASGTVKAISADSLTVSAAGGKEMVFSIDSTTKVTAKGASTKTGGAKVAITELIKAGDRVSVSYHDMSGKMHAAEVAVTAKAAAK